MAYQNSAQLEDVKPIWLIEVAMAAPLHETGEWIGYQFHSESNQTQMRGNSNENNHDQLIRSLVKAHV